MQGDADRVCLGLIPTSEGSWDKFFFGTSLCLFLVLLSETSLLAIIDMVIAHCNNTVYYLLV